MVVQVTEDHIDQGDYGICDSCPIALALKEMGYADVWVDDRWISLDGRDGKRYPIPRAVDLFIDDFDREREVKPFEFELILHDSQDS